VDHEDKGHCISLVTFGLGDRRNSNPVRTKHARDLCQNTRLIDDRQTQVKARANLVSGKRLRVKGVWSQTKGFAAGAKPGCSLSKVADDGTGSRILTGTAAVE
jgi:hypothetical protein